MNAIEVKDVSKYYTLTDSQWSRLRRIFSPVGPEPGQPSNGLAPRRGQGTRSLCVLQNVSFSLPQGEALGIVGANGAGKSTLLQIIAGILRPTSGSVQINGRCSTLLELGSGFAPEFTGRQNVQLNGTILGLSGEEIAENFEAIHRFSGIGDFIDQPIRAYSTGMVLRLAFAVAAHSRPRVLIVDEALAVGDVAFRQRCMRRIHELRSDGVSLLFVSHDSGDVKALCEKCLWLERGVVRGLGEADDVVARYLATTVNRGDLAKTTAVQAGSTRRPEPHDTMRRAISGPLAGQHRFGTGGAEVTGFGFPEAPGPDFWLRMQVLARDAIAAPIAGFLVRNEKGETIFGTNSARENHPLPPLLPGAEQTVDFRLTMPRLAPGVYSVSVAISDGSISEFQVCDYIEDALTFEVRKSGRPVSGYMEIPCRAVAIHRS